MLKFQKINPDDYNIIKNQLVSSFCLKDFERIITPYNVILAIGNWKEVLLVSDELLKIFEQFKSYRNPYMMGIHFGDLSKGKFRISLEGMALIAKHVERKTVLTEAGEKRALYKRDLEKENLLYIPARIQRDDLSILINEKEEVLALGKYLFGWEKINSLHKNKKIVKIVMDKGWYLRKGR